MEHYSLMSVLISQKSMNHNNTKYKMPHNDDIHVYSNWQIRLVYPHVEQLFMQYIIVMHNSIHLMSINHITTSTSLCNLHMYHYYTLTLSTVSTLAPSFNRSDTTSLQCNLLSAAMCIGVLPAYNKPHVYIMTLLTHYQSITDYTVVSECFTWQRLLLLILASVYM